MRLKTFFGIIGLSATLVLAGSAAVSAAPAVHSDFAAQGRTAGLTAAQIDSLQTEADGYLAELGGKQVALNQINLDGAIIRIALPGEAKPRQLGLGALDVNCDGGADHYHFCAYRGANYTGTQIDMGAALLE